MGFLVKKNVSSITPSVSSLASDSTFDNSTAPRSSSSTRPSTAPSSPVNDANMPSPNARWGRQEKSAPSTQPGDVDSCTFEIDPTLFPDLPEDNGLLTPEELAVAGDLPIFDSAGNSRPFKSLYSGEGVVGRQLVVFVRHFYCGACQRYLQCLTQAITPEAYFTLPIPTTIYVIGCGDPQLIRNYARNTTCPFQIFADPSRKLYKALKMGWSITVGPRPEYLQDINAPMLVVKSLTQLGRAPRREMIKGGPFTQIGGEFMFEDGQCVWGHRMRNVRDHTEIRELKRVLDMDSYENEAVIEEAATIEVVTPRQSPQGLKVVMGQAKSRDKILRPRPSNLASQTQDEKKPRRTYAYNPACTCALCKDYQKIAPAAAALV